MERFDTFWSVPDLFSCNPLRKLRRKIFISLLMTWLDGQHIRQKYSSLLMTLLDGQHIRQSLL